MPFHVPESNPRLLDVQFADAYPALGLTTTSNSGAFWGDGDLRAKAVDYKRILFAVESKARFRGSTAKRLVPKLDEWDKAIRQLHKFHPGAIRLFLIWSRSLNTFSVCMPIKDANLLIKAGFSSVEKMPIKSLRQGLFVFRFFDEFSFDEFYKEIEQAQPV